MFNERVNVRYIAHKQAFANNQSVYREAEPVVDDNKNITKSMQYKRILRDGFWKLEYEQQRRIINYLFNHGLSNVFTIRNRLGGLIQISMFRNKSGTELRVEPYSPNSSEKSYIWVTEDGIEHEAFYEDVRNVVTEDDKEIISMKRLVSYIDGEIKDDLVVSRIEANDSIRNRFSVFDSIPLDDDTIFEEHVVEKDVSLNDQPLNCYTVLNDEYPDVRLPNYFYDYDFMTYDYISEFGSYKEFLAGHFDNVEVAKLLYGMLPKYKKEKQFSK